MMRASVNKSTQNMDTFNGSSFDNTIPPVYFNNAVTEKMASSRYPTKPNDYISLPMVSIHSKVYIKFRTIALGTVILCV